MGVGIIVPVVLLLVVVPVVFMWARRQFKEGGNLAGLDGDGPDPSIRLTSNALRTLPAPPWRVVHEIASDKLGGIEHVLIGPAGIYALRTSMQPLPTAGDDEAAGDPRALARMAITRGSLDDVLRRCAMSSTALATVHWGASASGATAPAVDVLPGAIAVDGRSLTAWTDGLSGDVLTPAQVDLAWQTVVTAIGRPDPLR